MEKKTQFSLWYLVFALFAIFTLHDLWTQIRSVEPLPYSEFQRMVKAGEISEISITDNSIQGTLK
ncbi:MAG: ATP-dependent metallopeptidase FtsH/Yme1/Tma family protein, partial [Zoogloea sp.]|nr:ATP-dependent metallopeptidase FtsH/Yme1/Tma family protein [Zoogloea sp.]